MPWIKLNDNAPRHPKIAALSDRAFRVWIHSLCYAAEFLTDGLVPIAFLITTPRKIQDELMAAGLWRERAPGLVTIHDYLKHQTSKAAIEAERQRNIDRRTTGTTTGTTPVVPPKDRDQKIEGKNAQAVHPLTPSKEGAEFRPRREYLKQADAVLKSRLGYCQHDPECPTQVACRDQIALELFIKAETA